MPARKLKSLWRHDLCHRYSCSKKIWKISINQNLIWVTTCTYISASSWWPLHGLLQETDILLPIVNLCILNQPCNYGLLSYAFVATLSLTQSMQVDVCRREICRNQSSQFVASRPTIQKLKGYLWLCLNSHYSLCRCMTQRCPSYAIACSEACWTILKPGFSCSPTMGNHQISNRNWKDIQHCSPVLNNLHQSKIGLENFDLPLMIMKNWQTDTAKVQRSQALTPRDFNLLKLETDQDQPFLDMNSAQEPAVLSIPNNQTTQVPTHLKAYPRDVWK